VGSRESGVGQIDFPFPTPNSRHPSPDTRLPIRPPRFVVTLDAHLSEHDSLVRIPLAVTGRWVRDGSDFSITLGDLEEICNNFSKRRNSEINVDYDHASEMPEVAAGGPVPSAGRIVKLDAPEEAGVGCRVSQTMRRNFLLPDSLRPTPYAPLLIPTPVSFFTAGTSPPTAPAT
jgi:hypothetical protein